MAASGTAGNGRALTPSEASVFFNPSTWLKTCSLTNDIIFPEFTEWEKAETRFWDDSTQRAMWKAISQYHRMLQVARQREDFIAVNELDGEFAEARDEILKKHKKAMSELRWGVIRRMLKRADPWI